MDYLAKGRKAELRCIAEKIDEKVTEDLKIIHHKNLIMNSTNYEEGLVQEMLYARIKERMKASTSCVYGNYDTIEGHNSNPIELQKLPKYNAMQDDEIEIAENIAEDMENLLVSIIDDKDSINLIKINANEYIEVQQKSEELAPLIQKIEKGKEKENSNLLNQLENCGMKPVP
ncbi:hypothetical protein NPIL_576931 [Nephila pilipes]|uniref:Uncharacterized protein n=1 Tax=Nephila pilipes TaxID=299642 RepID=A0A8X6NC41_NEPPI|nr:hypothetical protein NPIL_576931 [Nephila pilipes]